MQGSLTRRDDTRVPGTREARMKISLLDRSLYLKGLMLLLRKDGQIRDRERKIVLRIGDILGFDDGFCRQAIAEILENKYIIDVPPRFSTPDVARCFIQDAVRICRLEKDIHESETDWLKLVARENNLDMAWDSLMRGGSGEEELQGEKYLRVTRLKWE